MGFTAVLNTAQCRPGNIVLARNSSGQQLMAAAALAASSLVAAHALLDHPVSATMDGSSSVTAHVGEDHPASVSMDGGSSVSAHLSAQWSAVVAIQGNSAFVVYPGNVVHSFPIPFIPPPKRPPIVQVASQPVSPSSTIQPPSSQTFPRTGLGVVRVKV